MNSHPPYHKKNLISSAFKYLIAVVSVAGTIGLWGAFSKKADQSSITQVTEPPLPTIVTLVSFNQPVAISTPATGSSISPLPVVTQPPAISYTNSTTQLAQPTPITSSKSSH
jgi:hypothetical protein